MKNTQETPGGMKVSVFTFDDPDSTVNVFDTKTLKELEEYIDKISSDKEVQGIIFTSAKPSIFIAGADLREFVASLGAPADEIEAMCHRGQTLFSRLSKVPFVTVAAIDGICVGGGAEMAVWCDRCRSGCVLTGSLGDGGCCGSGPVTCDGCGWVAGQVMSPSRPIRSRLRAPARSSAQLMALTSPRHGILDWRALTCPTLRSARARSR